MPPPQRTRLNKFYAIREGKDGFTGVVRTWEECEALVTRVPNCVHQRFDSRIAAEAFANSEDPHAAQGSSWEPRVYKVRLPSGREFQVEGWSAASKWSQDSRCATVRRQR